jgi:hypothetical protein
MCVNTIVLSNPMRRANRPATQSEPAARMCELKNIRPSAAAAKHHPK